MEVRPQLGKIKFSNPPTELQGRLCVLMVHGLSPLESGEKIYPWAERIGLPKSTLYQILKGTLKMQLRVADRVSLKTGANVRWLVDGSGKPFEDMTGFPSPQVQEIIESIEKNGAIPSRLEEYFSEASNKIKVSLSSNLDKSGSLRNVSASTANIKNKVIPITLSSGESIVIEVIDHNIVSLAFSIFFKRLSLNTNNISNDLQAAYVTKLYEVLLASKKGECIADPLIELINLIESKTTLDSN